MRWQGELTALTLLNCYMEGVDSSVGGRIRWACMEACMEASVKTND